MLFDHQNRLVQLVAAAAGMVVLAAAAAAEPFTVSGVEIDATGNTAFDAQREAMASGQRRAAQILIERLTLAEDRMDSGLAVITAETASGLIAGLQISDEQRSATRYRGVLSVQFDRREVRQYLGGLGVAYVESQAAPVLVVPLLEGPGGDVVWEGPWQDAWLRGHFETALTPFIALGAPRGAGGVPVGRGAITPREARALDEAALGALARAYGVNRVAVITAREGAGAVRAGGVELEFTPAGVVRTEMASVAAPGGYLEAAQRIVERREADWKRVSVVRGGEAAELEVTLVFSSLNEWRGLQRAVAGASLIQSARLDALSRKGAAMTIIHRGTRAQVASELNARGARLEQDGQLGWTVRAL